MNCETNVEFATLKAQDPKRLANALSLAIKRVHGQISAWYRVNALCRELEDIEESRSLDEEEKHEPPA